MVDLPEPDKPVKNIVNPFLCKGSLAFFNSFITSGNENHSGIIKSLSSLFVIQYLIFQQYLNFRDLINWTYSLYLQEKQNFGILQLNIYLS